MLASCMNHTATRWLATPGKPLLEMEDSTALRLEADVPEAVVGKLKLNDRLPVRISALEKELEGVVSEIAPAADPNSRTFLVKLDLPATAGLRAGQFGRVAMPVGETSALRVPAAALVQRGQMELVFVITDGKAQLRLVKTGKRVGEGAKLVFQFIANTSGITPTGVSGPSSGNDRAFVTTARRGQNCPLTFDFQNAGTPRAVVQVYSSASLAGTLAGVEMGLGLAGIPHKTGGAQAAMDNAVTRGNKVLRDFEKATKG